MSQAPKVDGRTLRSERSRQKIIDAIVELVNDDILVPTAQQVAERANVGIRTVFRHFNEMDELHLLIDQQVKDDYNAVFAGGDRSGELNERIDALVLHFSKAFEQTTNLHRSTDAQMWRLEVLHDSYSRNVQKLLNNIRDWLPELNTADKVTIEAVSSALSFEAWHRMRSIRGLNSDEAQAVMRKTLKALLC